MNHMWPGLKTGLARSPNKAKQHTTKTLAYSGVCTFTNWLLKMNIVATDLCVLSGIITYTRNKYNHRGTEIIDISGS